LIEDSPNVSRVDDDIDKNRLVDSDEPCTRRPRIITTSRRPQVIQAIETGAQLNFLFAKCGPGAQPVSLFERPILLAKVGPHCF
jgi:hypothetical protein